MTFYKIPFFASLCKVFSESTLGAVSLLLFSVLLIMVATALLIRKPNVVLVVPNVKGGVHGFASVNIRLPPDIVKALSKRADTSITLEGLEKIVNMEKDEYVIMRTYFDEGNHTILFSPDGTLRIINAHIENDEIEKIINGYRTKNYPIPFSESTNDRLDD